MYGMGGKEEGKIKLKTEPTEISMETQYCK